MAHDDPNSSAVEGDQPTSDPSTAFQALVSELSEKLDEARSHLDQSGSAFRELVAQTQSELEATVRRELTAALPEAEVGAVTESPDPTTSARLREAVEQIDGAESQAEVLSRMLEQVGGVCGRAALLLGRSMEPIESQPSLSIWNAVGFGRESFDGVEVETPQHWRPALVADAALQLSSESAAPLTDALGGDGAENAVLIPFVLRDAAYAVLYADDHGNSLDADAVQLLCFVASQAMECLAVRSARPAATIATLEDAVADGPAVDSAPAGATDAPADGPSTPAFFASPPLQGVAEIEADEGPATTDAEDDSPTQTDGIPWPQEAAEVDEPAPELLDTEPDEPEPVADEDAVSDSVTAETSTPTWIEAESETPSEGIVVDDLSPREDTVEVIEPEPVAPASVAADSFVSAIDEPTETFETADPIAPVEPIAPPPPPPPIQAPEEMGFTTRAVADAAPAPEPIEDSSSDGGSDASSPVDETPSGATPFLARDPAQETAPPRPAAFDTLADTPSAEPPSDTAGLPAGNETVAIPPSSAEPVSPVPAEAPQAPVAAPPAARTPDISAEEPAEIEVPKTPPATSPGSSEVRPPQNLDGPGKAFVRETSSDEDPRDDEARRLARLLVSELKLYNEDEIGRGKRAGNIYQHLREDIDRSRRIYEERIADEVRQRHDFLQEELVRGLADGNPELLGM